MFDMTRPCVDCPARKGNGEKYRMSKDRLEGILNATAFQCHKTVEYVEGQDGFSHGMPGARPQQCAGMMAVMKRSNRQNAIMQIAVRLGELDPETIDPQNEAYDSVEDMISAHSRPRERQD